MKSLGKIYAWVLLAPAFLPLLFVEGMMYPLMAPKTFALRALGLVALALFSYLALNGHAFYYERLRNRLAWLPGAFLAVAYVASLFGADFYRSFWSTFERGDGLLTLSVCVGYFYLLVLSFDRALLDKLIKVAAWVGSLAALYLILQWLETLGSLDLPLIVRPNGRVGGTMGNAAFAASYLGMAFFVTLAAAREYAGGARRLLYAGAGLELIAILLTATRGTMVALFVIGVAMLLVIALSPSEAARRTNDSKTRPSGPERDRLGAWRRRLWAQGGLAILVIVAGLFFVFRGQLANVPFEPVRRLASISLTDGTVASRLFLWQTLSREALGQPLLGYGAEHISIPFDRIYDPTAIQEEWFDRSHNAYLDRFLEFGIGGGLLYIGLVLTFLYLAWRRHKAGERLGFWLFLLAGTYALQNIFVFDTGVTFWLFLALFAGLFVQPEARASVLARRPAAGFVVPAVLLLLIVPVAIQPLRANLLAFESYLYQIADVPRANAAAQRALALHTYADLELGYNAYFMYTEEQIRRLSGQELLKAYENATSILTRNFASFPYDARTAVYLAQVLASAPEGASLDRRFLSDVIARSLEQSPKRAQSWYLLANLSIESANQHPVGAKERQAGYEAAKDILKQYVELVPGSAEPYFVLAQLEYASGNKSAAAERASRGKELYIGGLGAARRAAQYYETVLDLENAAFFLREILRHVPDENAAADLAQIESYLGIGTGETPQ
ncbi:O-antigen ligase family protein [Candidatus Kaiserbacteria bacterium]|nr:O-antigen ligase family protein [Candidatus Kaiserbacteria bacterium]